MTIRNTIIVLTIPLFLSLALVNGAVLYFKERGEMEKALREQAQATAVTIAEFVRDMDDPRATFAQPLRDRALRHALAHVEGLNGLYLIEPGRVPLAIDEPTTPWDVSALAVPSAVRTIGPSGAEATGRWVTALASAGGQRLIAARISADPIAARLEKVRLEILLVLLFAGIFAIGLSLLVAHRITRELGISRQRLGQDGKGHVSASSAGFRIREAGDLAEAARLIEASRKAADAHSRLLIARMNKDLDLQNALKRIRSQLFAPSTIRIDDAELAMRLCGEAPMGCFFACLQTDRGGAVVLGRCMAETPVDQLASAVAVRRIIEDTGATQGLDHAVGLARLSCEIDMLDIREWRHGEVRSDLFTLTDEITAERAERYCGAGPRIAPDVKLEGLATMLSPIGVFAALRVGMSADSGQCASDVGRDGEDTAETADFENFQN